MRVGVVGGGLMGSGIAEVCARSGVDVTVVEADDERAERSRAAIEKSLDRAVRAGKLEQDDRDAALDRLAFTRELRGHRGLRRRDRGDRRGRAAPSASCSRAWTSCCPTPSFLASNTSSVPIMKLGAGTKQPDRVLGLHFFNPVPVLPLVEIVTRS